MSIGTVCFFANAEGKGSSGGERLERATFAGGCFWCVQHAFDHVFGVATTKVGFTGGDKKNPTYEEVSTGTTGHVEALQITYDPKEISYKKILDIYWHSIDPIQSDGQFCDIGPQYRPIIFYHSEEQRRLAERSKKELQKSQQNGPISVEILPAKTFYPAEDYHQEYYKKSPIRYKFYRDNSGRDKRLKEIWGK